MIGKCRFEQPDKLIFEGYPTGTAVCQLGIPEEADLRRLYLYRVELQRSISWLEGLDKLPVEDPCREALAISALVRFCGCFESTAGHRRQPLKPSKVFDAAQRPWFTDLKRLRDKLIVHDEQLYPFHLSWIAITREGRAIEAGAVGIMFGLSQMVQLGHLKELMVSALSWTVTEFEKVAEQAVATINALSPEDVLKEVESAGSLNIKVQFAS